MILIPTEGRPKDPAESIVVPFDFSDELDAIDNVTVSVAIYGEGIDEDVASILDGAAQISGTVVLQRVKAGVDGVDYSLRAVGTKTGGDTIVRAGVMPVRTANKYVVP